MTPETERVLAKVADDEPIFILRASDALAPQVILEWIRLAKRNCVSHAKIVRAKQHADALWSWQLKHGAKLPD